MWSLLITVTASASLAIDFKAAANPSVSENALTANELRQILLANRTTWKDGKRITIVTLNYEFPGADSLTEDTMGMTGVQAKKYWLTKVFNGDIPSQPLMGDNAEEVVEKVLLTPGAIAVVPRATKTDKVKVLYQSPHN